MDPITDFSFHLDQLPSMANQGSRLRYTPACAGQQLARRLSSIVAIPIRSNRSVLACRFSRCFLSWALTLATNQPLDRIVLAKFSAYELNLRHRKRHGRTEYDGNLVDITPSTEFLTPNGFRRISPFPLQNMTR